MLIGWRAFLSRICHGSSDRFLRRKTDPPSSLCININVYWLTEVELQPPVTILIWWPVKNHYRFAARFNIHFYVEIFIPQSRVSREKRPIIFNEDLHRLNLDQTRHFETCKRVCARSFVTFLKPESKGQPVAYMCGSNYGVVTVKLINTFGWMRFVMVFLCSCYLVQRDLNGVIAYTKNSL